MDFSVYVYKLADNSKQIISNATQPSWLDETTIVYRKYEKGGHGLWLWDVRTGKTEKINEVVDGAYHPETQETWKKIVYTVYPEKEVWLYDVTKKAGHRLVDQAINSFFVTPTKIIYEEVGPCNGDEEECGAIMDYKVKAVAVFDIEGNNKTGVIPDLVSTGWATSVYR